MVFHIFIFAVSCLILFLSGKLLVDSLTRIARFLEWREFVVAFIVVAMAASIPNLFVGITSAVYKIPQLSFGDIVGGNLVDLTIAVAFAAFFAKGLPAESKMVQTSAVLTMFIAILPLLLILDGVLGRGDGLILILTFFLYIFWLFSKKERFTKIYDGKTDSITEASTEVEAKRTSSSSFLPFVATRAEKKEFSSNIKNFKVFIKDIFLVLLGVIFLMAAAQGIVKSAFFFSTALNLPLVLVGILIVGLSNAIPETYFAVVAARKAKTWMILGDLMGSVIICATLVLGIVALIEPIEITDFSPFAFARFFLIVAAMFFLFFVRTDRRLSRKEALFLLGVYATFVITEILTK